MKPDRIAGDGFRGFRFPASPLREETEFAKIPVIMITARTQDDDIERGFKLGATDYILKPFNLKDLTTKIASILNLK